MKLTLLMGIFPIEEYQNIIDRSKCNVQFAADALQKAIIHGLTFWTKSIQIINLPYIGSFPLRDKILFTDKYNFSFKTVAGFNIPFCNLCGWKLFSRFFRSFFALKKYVGFNDIILIYSVHTPFIKACIDFKKKNPNTKIVLLVADLPEYMLDNKGVIRNYMEKINQRLLSKFYKQIDGFILLSKHMIDKLPVADKPWVVVEGIYSDVDEKVILSTKEQDGKYVLYTGTLAKRYGITRLVKAFLKVNIPDIKLVICGDGDAKEEIVEYSRYDSRIVYKGLIKREEALTLQKNATLLVNPRTSEGEFTKYSFPSKTMEYLASGVPTLLYRLPGIPDEYYDYCYSLVDTSISSLTDALESILRKDVRELALMGERARRFILNEKSPKQQAKKIYDLINRL